jgi:hypothetical protein
MQMGGNDGTCLLKGSLAMYMVHDPGIKPLNDWIFSISWQWWVCFVALNQIVNFSS